MAVNKNVPNAKSVENGPVMLLTPCHNSHEFQDRKVVVPRGEENAIKIGRAVGRFAATPNNAIFDCKVLSRNHAVIWCEDEIFYIKDTKSSNGTFINNHRLSPSSEVSGPVPLNTGDILQLGVEIVDNTKRVASGCVVAMVRFVNDKGEEMGNRRTIIHDTSTMSERIPKNCLVVSEEQMYQMQQYIFEAKHRESSLGNKLLVLQEALKSAKIAAEANWQAMINEDRLLSRIEVLESQLSFCLNKNLTDAELRAKTQEIFTEREKLEVSTKERLRKHIEEASEARLRHEEAEIALMNVEEQNAMLKEGLADAHHELSIHRTDTEKLNSNYEIVCRELETTRSENLKLLHRIKDLELEKLKLAEEALENATSTSDIVTLIDPAPSVPAPVDVFPKVKLPSFVTVLTNRIPEKILELNRGEMERVQKCLEGLASEGSAFPVSPLDIQHMICDLMFEVASTYRQERQEKENKSLKYCCFQEGCDHKDLHTASFASMVLNSAPKKPQRTPEEELISIFPLFSLIVLIYYHLLAFTNYLPKQFFTAFTNVDHDTATGLDIESDNAAASSPPVESATEAEKKSS